MNANEILEKYTKIDEGEDGIIYSIKGGKFYMVTGDYISALPVDMTVKIYATENFRVVVSLRSTCSNKVFSTLDDAVMSAENALTSTPENYISQAEYITRTGKRMISNRDGKTIDGETFLAGTPIIYTQQGILKQ